jgi:hypothetical protein
MPTINVENLVFNAQKKLSLSPSESDILNIGASLKKINSSSVFSIVTYSELPLASPENLGKLYYVQSDNTIYQLTFLDSTYFWKPLAQNFKSSLWSVGYNGYSINGNPSTSTCCFQPITSYVPTKSLYNICDIHGQNQTLTFTDYAANGWVMGYNPYGNLGTGDCCSCAFFRKLPGDWKSIKQYMNFVGVAIKTNGQLNTSGYSYYQSLGLGCSDNQNVTTFTPVLGFSGECVIDATHSSGYSGAAIKDDGSLWTWGWNTSWMLGIGCCNSNCFSSPVTVAGGGNNWVCVTSSYYGYNALKTDGNIWAWGSNSYGQVGDGTNITRCSPVTNIGNAGNWCALNSSGGDNNTNAAIKTDGTLWLWGYTCFGQIGNGTSCTSGIFSPVQTSSGGTNWCCVSIGCRNVAAVKTDGTLWTWGCNDYGQLGYGVSPGVCCIRLEPTPTCPGGKNNWWKTMSQYYNTIALDKYDVCSI